MKIVVLDGYTENPGDLSWKGMEAFGEVTVYDRVSYVDSPVIAEKLGDAEVAVVNKTPITKATNRSWDSTRWDSFWRSARTTDITTRLSRKAAGRTILTGATGIIR